MTEKAQQSPVHQGNSRSEKSRRPSLPTPAYPSATSEMLSLHDDIGNLGVNTLLDDHQRVPVGTPGSQHERLAEQMEADGAKGADSRANGAISSQRWSLAASTAHAFRRALAIGGEPLSGKSRRQMEEQFGQTLDRVQLHHDASANQIAGALNARALTFGRHIFFDGSTSRDDDALLSHELTHVLQQESQPHALIQRKPKHADPPVSAKQKRKILAVVFYRNSDVVTLQLDSGDEITLQAAYNGKPEPGIYTLTRAEGEFKSTPPIPGTQNKKGFVVEWTMPEDVTFSGVTAYTFTVVDDQPGEITAPPLSNAQDAEQGVGNNSEPSQTGTQQDPDSLQTLPLPEDILEMVGGAEQLTQHDPEVLHRVLTELMLLTPREREIYRQMATRTTNDLEELERSIRQFVLFHLDTQEKASRVMERVEEGRWNVDSIMADWTDQEMLQLDPEDRLAIISSIAEGYFVLNKDERTLIRLLTNITPSDTPELMAGLKKDKARLLKRLIKVMDGAQYQEFLHKLRPVFLASLTPGQAVAEMESAAELPWSDPGLIKAVTKVRIYYEEVELTDKGTLRIKAWINTGPFGLPAEPLEIDPFAMIAVRFLHDEPSMGVKEGEVVFMPAFNLLALENKQFKAEMALVADVALLFAGGLGVVSAGSKARKVLAALDLALGAADLAIREFHAEIAKSPAGRKFLRAWSAVTTVIQIYSLARVVASAPSAFRNLRDTFQEYKAAAGSTVDQAQLARVESSVDDVLQEAETAQRKLAESVEGGGQKPPGTATTAGDVPQGSRGATADAEGVTMHPPGGDPEVVHRRSGAPAAEETGAAQRERTAVGEERDPDFAEGITREEFGAAQGKIDDAVRTRENRFRQRSREEMERAEREQSRPDRETEQRAKVRESHDAGVEGGRAQAAREGIQIEEWDTPQKWIPEFGRGIDDIGRRNRKVIIVEHKGGASDLGGDQMSNAWVGRKIAQLEVLNDPMAQTLLDAVKNRNLQGVVYSTQLERTALNTQRMSGELLSRRLTDTAVSNSGLIQYAPTKVMRAYRQELARLREAIARGDLEALRNL